MDGALFTLEPWIRVGVFAGMLALMVGWEATAPRRALSQPRSERWTGNLGIVAIDTVLVRLLFPLTAVSFAAGLEANGHGLSGLGSIPYWLRVVVAVVLLDLAIYLQHVLFHHVPWLWRLHRMHHADLDFDTTTGVRFHPLEIVLSMLIKLGVIALIGAPAVAVLLFEVILNATSLFNHGNVRLPAAIDRRLRLVVVTPEMHRVHHSVIRRETDSNFGFNLPWWDHLFGTYRAQPEKGHLEMTIGIEQFRGAGESRLDRLLRQPFRGD